jgi:TDG/mug DNA glycosylase family protein
MTRPLPDYLRPGLDLVFVGINPGARSAAAGHHYAGSANLFWPLLFESGLVPERLTYDQDARVLDYGIGLTNMVARSTPGLSDLTVQELRDGAVVLRRKLRHYRPRVVCFNGKRIYEIFAGRPATVGLQPELAEGAIAYVMPSTSPRGASYQRADKKRFFVELRGTVERERARRTAS